MKKFMMLVLVSVITTEAFSQQLHSASNSGEAHNKIGQAPSAAFGEKVAGGLQAGAPAIVTGVSSVGGTAKPGGAVSSSYAAGRLSMTPTTTKQTQGMNFGEKVAQGIATDDPAEGTGNQARPGQPIKGVIVKGGKNPGGNMMTIISNEMGIFELNGITPGSYRFILMTPDVREERSISEKGVKRQEAARTETRTYTGGRKNALQENSIDANEMEAPGTPIGGIVVKGGKNPGGTMTNLQVSENGEIRFEVLEAGNYQFMIQTGNDAHESNTHQGEQKVVEKATSGLKDTLKTNV